MLPIKIQLYLILILTALYMPLSTMDLIDSMKSESPIIDLKQTSDEWNVERELQKKDQGNQVKILQQLLNRVGYSLEITGSYNENTTWAVTDFQLQHEELLATGIYNQETNTMLNKYIENGESIIPGLGLPFSRDYPTANKDVSILTNPYDQLAIINKEYALPHDYEPNDLVIPNVRFPFTEDLPKKQMRKVAADALEDLFEAADEEGLELFAQSGYRSFERQEQIFTANASTYGEERANSFSARPGESEHQSGLTMDVTSPKVNFELVVDFGETPEGIWIREHAADYGFIIRFPEGKEAITGYQYEPWHLRFVGKKAAREIMENNLTLEEYLLKK